jgi:DNA-binding transcriptional MerR regulator
MIKVTFKDKEVEVKERLSLANKLEFSSYVVAMVTDTDSLSYSPLYYDVALIQAFFTYYVEDMETPSIQEVDENYDEYKGFIKKITNLGFNIGEYQDLIDNIDYMIKFNKEIMIHNQKSAMDEMFDEASKLLQTLNSKAEQLDPKKLERMLKKLNPKELIKEYQNSGIGDSVRDKAIQELSAENKQLRNKETARNVQV